MALQRGRLPNCQGVKGPQSAESAPFHTSACGTNDLRKMSLESRLPTQRAGKFKNKDGILNHRLSLSLGLLENAAEFLRFGLQFCNHSEVNLLLPYPEIHGLRFGNKATLQESEWYTGILMRSSDWAGFTLGPGHTKSFEYRVRPTHV